MRLLHRRLNLLLSRLGRLRRRRCLRKGWRIRCRLSGKTRHDTTSKCNALYARILEDCDIDEVIRNQPTVLPGEVQQLIRSMTGEFLSEFYNFLRERGIDVTTSKCVFAGGGSLLLRGMIERANKVAFPIFIEDIHANARGYELLYQSEVTSNGQ